MLMDDRGGNIIFLISQPRSGSTLLQHILGSHTQIHTLPEPWVMLPLVYLTRHSGLEADYNGALAQIALRDFLARVKNGEVVFADALRGIALRLYEAALAGSGKSLYLDKTTRYYLIIPELRAMFPDARFVLLIRNPLAVFLSILEINLHGNVSLFNEPGIYHDILTAPHLMNAAARQAGGRMAVVHYEELVQNPQRVVADMCRKIELPFEPAMIEYGDKVRFAGSKMVDPKSIYRHNAPVTDYVDQWWSKIDSAQKLDALKNYLAALGEELVTALGYSYSELSSRLASIQVPRGWVLPWKLISTPRQDWSRLDRIRFKVIRKMQKRSDTRNRPVKTGDAPKISSQD